VAAGGDLEGLLAIVKEVGIEFDGRGPNVEDFSQTADTPCMPAVDVPPGTSVKPEAHAPSIRRIEDIPPVSACGAREISYLIEPVLPESAVVALT
jgi:hypothetical protein